MLSWLLLLLFTNFLVEEDLSLRSKFRSLVEDTGRNLILPLLLKDALACESRVLDIIASQLLFSDGCMLIVLDSVG
jgi:hypothetical protein